jgi:hypothetical protein
LNCKFNDVWNGIANAAEPAANGFAAKGKVIFFRIMVF